MVCICSVGVCFCLGQKKAHYRPCLHTPMILFHQEYFPSIQLVAATSMAFMRELQVFTWFVIEQYLGSWFVRANIIATSFFLRKGQLNTKFTRIKSLSIIFFSIWEEWRKFDPLPLLLCGTLMKRSLHTHLTLLYLHMFQCSVC